jgi:ubiquinone/menaquinone biosynthesis C-methylase UbiE
VFAPAGTGLFLGGVKVEHKDRMREEFTRQASEYAAAPLIKDADHIARLVREVIPRFTDRVLEIATGPGHVALAFAPLCREVVGIDLTEAPLEIAERMRAERGIANARFQLADADRVPFGDAEFDIVVCRFAVHHFDQPAQVIGEMARVCRPGGRIAIEDLVASEHPARADFYNRFERLRDTSHTRALPLSELVRTIAQAGLEIVRFGSDAALNPVEQWLTSAHTPPDRAKEVRAMLERDVREDLSGVNTRVIDGALYFTHRLAIVVGRKLGRRAAA